MEDRKQKNGQLERVKPPNPKALHLSSVCQSIYWRSEGGKIWGVSRRRRREDGRERSRRLSGRQQERAHAEEGFQRWGRPNVWKKPRSEGEGPPADGAAVSDRPGWETFVLDSSAFETYYRKQEILPPEE